jgi:hypothetical protein
MPTRFNTSCVSIQFWRQDFISTETVRGEALFWTQFWIPKLAAGKFQQGIYVHIFLAL